MPRTIDTLANKDMYKNLLDELSIYMKGVSLDEGEYKYEFEIMGELPLLVCAVLLKRIKELEEKVWNTNW